VVEDFTLVAVGRNFFVVKPLANFDWLVPPETATGTLREPTTTVD